MAKYRPTYRGVDKKVVTAVYGEKSKFSGLNTKASQARKQVEFERKTEGRYGTTGICPCLNNSLQKERDRFFTVA